jgi:hypothetical protein
MRDVDNSDIAASKITVLRAYSAISHSDYYLKKASTFFLRICGLAFLHFHLTT